MDLPLGMGRKWRQAVNKKTGKINKIITAFHMCYDKNR